MNDVSATAHDHSEGLLGVEDPSGAQRHTQPETHGVVPSTSSISSSRLGLPSALDGHAAKTPKGYAGFREMLKHPSAQPLMRRLLDFVQGFQSELSQTQASQKIHRFLTQTQEWMLSECVVFAANADDEGRSDAAEGLEKFVLVRLHPKLFSAGLETIAEDAKVRKCIDGLAWVTLVHLAVPPIDASLFALAVTELQRMDNFKAPKDKLVCILNACRVITDVLKMRLIESGHARPLSADDFLPLLIYSVIMANPPRLHSNLDFIGAFRHPSRFIGEDAYYLTTLQSAVAFVKDAGPKVLEVTAEEFERLRAESLASRGYNAAGQLANATGGHLTSPQSEKVSDPQTPSTVAEKAAKLTPEMRQLVGRRLEKLSLHFEHVQSSRQMRIDDVATMLGEYRTMAQLLRDVENCQLEDERHVSWPLPSAAAS